MADVYIKDGEGYSRSGKQTVVHVVRGDKGPQPHKAGQIIEPRFSRNNDCYLLDVKWATREGVRIAATEVRIHPDYRKMGWITLQDAYEQEGNPEGFQEYLEFYHDQVADPVGMRDVDFPEEKLPKVVQKLRAGRFDDKAGTKRWKEVAEKAKPSTPEADPKTRKPKASAKPKESAGAKA